MANKIIEVKNLVKEYKLPKEHLFQLQAPTLTAVNNVSFDVYKGETLGIVGESGSGKSTVARLVNKLTSITSGEIYYNGQNISELTKEEEKKFRRSQQMVFQSPYGALDPRRTIRYSLEEPFIIHGIKDIDLDKRINELLELVNMPKSSLEKYPHELSGGQLQRINIARAISLNPDVVICDEAVSALDVSVQAQILNLLCDLQDELDLTYLFISHDLNVVRFMCDRIIVMQEGGIVEEGTAKEIYDNPQDDYTKTLLAEIPTNSPYERKILIGG